MNVKRILTAIIGLPIIILLLIFGNKYVIDMIVAAICVVAIYEYSKCISKEVRFISWVGYLASISIAFMHVIPTMALNTLITLGVPILLVLLYATVVVTNMKYTFKDMAFSFAGILYITAFMGFLPLLYGVTGKIDGKILVWYILLCSWGTDSVAYIIGKNFGKHKFSKISPNKTIEGCVGGLIGAVLASLIFTFIINNYIITTNVSYLAVVIISAVLSIIGQLGDFSASSIKRYFEIKDFSELFPGHGGMIDRIDSVMFIAPFAYFLLTMFL